MSLNQCSGDAVDFVIINGFGAFHIHKVAGRVGIDVEHIDSVVSKAIGLIVLSEKDDVVDIQHELVRAAEVDDGHIDVLALISAEVDVEFIPIACCLGSKGSFPNDGEVRDVGVP